MSSRRAKVIASCLVGVLFLVCLVVISNNTQSPFWDKAAFNSQYAGQTSRPGDASGPAYYSTPRYASDGRAVYFVVDRYSPGEDDEYQSRLFHVDCVGEKARAVSELPDDLPSDLLDSSTDDYSVLDDAYVLSRSPDAPFSLEVVQVTTETSYASVNELWVVEEDSGRRLLQSLDTGRETSYRDVVWLGGSKAIISAYTESGWRIQTLDVQTGRITASAVGDAADHLGRLVLSNSKTALFDVVDSTASKPVTRLMRYAYETGAVKQVGTLPDTSQWDYSSATGNVVTLDSSGHLKEFRVQ